MNFYFTFLFKVSLLPNHRNVCLKKNIIIYTYHFFSEFLRIVFLPILVNFEAFEHRLNYSKLFVKIGSLHIKTYSTLHYSTIWTDGWIRKTSAHVSVANFVKEMYSKINHAFYSKMIYYTNYLLLCLF